MADIDPLQKFKNDRAEKLKESQKAMDDAKTK